MNPNENQQNSQQNPQTNNVQNPPINQETKTEKVIRRTGIVLSLATMVLAIVTTFKKIFRKR